MATTEVQTPHVAKYRSDIDGLRAIAVLLVVGFHSFPSKIPSGFIGVDVFFVISGFLISSILFDHIKQGKLSLGVFYRRRILRIFPALSLVLIFVYLYGWFFSFNEEFKQLGKHIFGGASFVSNIMLWNESGYFDSAAETKPLLHLWSLAIEEQFYLVWPLILIIGNKIKKSLLGLTMTLLLLSFVSNILCMGRGPIEYYSPWNRFFELLIGAMTSHLFYQIPRPAKQFTNSSISNFGGALLAAGLLAVGIGKTRFPGWVVLLPTLGTALIIYSGKDAWFNQRLLSNSILRRIGLISFPFYLWHWPLLVFLRIQYEQVPPWPIRILAVGASIVLSWITYRCVETPFRESPKLKKNSTILFLAMMCIAVVGGITYLRDGWPSRSGFPVSAEGDIGNELFEKIYTEKFFPCSPLYIRKEALTDGNFVRCFQSLNEAPVQIALIGDSHAEALFFGLAEEAPKINIAYYIQDAVPLIENSHFESIFKYVLDNPGIKTVIMTAYWGVRFGNSPAEVNEASLKLSSTVHSLINAGKKVYIIDDTPNFSFDAKKCKYQRNRWSQNLCSQEKIHFDSEKKRYAPIFDYVQKANHELLILPTLPYFCDTETCKMADNGELYYRDYNHLNINGSKFVGKRIIKDNPSLLVP